MENVAAFLTMIAISEGTEHEPDPFRVCYAKRHTIIDFTYHPHQLRPDGTREWAGEKLTDAQCAAVGLHPGCISSAAGRYQITWGTFDRLQGNLKVPDFTPASQDDCAIELLKEVGALEFVNRGGISEAIALSAHLWASLPGNTAKQPQTRMTALLSAYTGAGGQLA
jgi:muramidase (phage lysozyme)